MPNPNQTADHVLFPQNSQQYVTDMYQMTHQRFARQYDQLMHQIELQHQQQQQQHILQEFLAQPLNGLVGSGQAIRSDCIDDMLQIPSSNNPFNMQLQLPLTATAVSNDVNTFLNPGRSGECSSSSLVAKKSNVSQPVCAKSLIQETSTKDPFRSSTGKIRTWSTLEEIKGFLLEDEQRDNNEQLFAAADIDFGHSKLSGNSQHETVRPESSLYLEVLMCFKFR